MPILNYTTKIAASQTAGQIQPMLAQHGASAVRVEYENRKPVAVAFEIDTPTLGRQFYAWRVNVDGVLLSMQEDAKVPSTQCTRDQAERVAWRIEKDWLEAMLAKVEALRTPLEQIMLPYLMTDGGGTLYEAMVERHENKQLQAAEKD